MEIELLPQSSLVKVFPDARPAAPAYSAASMLRGEVFSYQIAYYARFPFRASARVEVDGDLPATVREVGLEPVELATYPGTADAVPEEYLHTTAGLFPDPLLPLRDGVVRLHGYEWRALWVTVDGRQELAPGAHILTVRLTDTETGEELGRTSFALTVLDAALPEQTLLFTEWFHCDCIADWYKAPMMSERHWALIEQYAATAVRNGVNMLLTPLFTPPLDTNMGAERPTMQLVRVDVTEEGYTFDFSLLGRWIAMCRRVGVRYFEMSHLFTQWGGWHAPKVMGWRGGACERLFGWDTDSAGPAYTAFLEAFLPALVEYLRAQGVYERCYFHVSDEPPVDCLDRYRALRELLARYVCEDRMMDALSHYAFYETGLVKLPIPDNEHVHTFLDHGVSPVWTYYCCGEHTHVSNRFLAQPSVSNRIIGAQMYKYHIAGFLQWGYNYWYCHQSEHLIDPYRVADGECAWPAGDPFSVYPGPDGPVESLRLVVFHEALQDMRAMALLAERKGRARVDALIEEYLGALRFDDFPRDDSRLLGLRARINEELAAR